MIRHNLSKTPIHNLPEQPAVQATVRVDQVTWALDTLWTLSTPDSRFGFSPWIVQTAHDLPPDVQQTHRLVCSALLGGHSLRQQWPSFPAYLESLEAKPAEQLRDDNLDDLASQEWVCKDGLDLRPHLHDETAFLQEAREHWERLQIESEKDIPFDQGSWQEAFRLYNDPPALKRLLVYHLWRMWDQVLHPNWQQTLPMLEETAAAYQQVDLSGMSALQVIWQVTGRDVAGMFHEPWPPNLVLVPSTHIGPYVSEYQVGDATAHLVFGTRLPSSALSRSSSTLSQAELLHRIEALADETRLQILNLLTEHEELYAQEIMEALKLGQSTTSRHMRQLIATGFVSERRQDVAKRYRLNPAQGEDTLHALRKLLTPSTGRRLR
jgi:DNA-binding transcriptional ArsR family regulator